MKLYPFQAKAIGELQGDKHMCIANTGTGKGSIALHWARNTGRPNVLIISTASKRDVKDSLGRNDFEAEADAWFGSEWRDSLSSFTVISWQGLAKWYKEQVMFGPHKDDFAETFAVVGDEIACMKAGVSSKRGKVFLAMAKQNDCWTGYTATPGDRWIDFYAYFQACGKVKNKTEFKRKFCNIQNYKGFPEIVGYNNEDTLKHYWEDISLAVNSEEVEKQMPSETHQVVEFKKPTGYDKFMKDRIHPKTGEFCDNIMSVCHTARQLCWSKEKAQWIGDFIEGLGDRALFLYNYIEEGDGLEAILKKKLPKGAKIWRIDGKHHDVPVEENMGKYDVVLAQWTSGSMGLNLQFVNYWVSVSPNYSYSISEQGRGRIKRIGQKNKMHFYYLHCKGTIEVAINKALKNKSDFAEDVWALENNIKEGE